MLIQVDLDPVASYKMAAGLGKKLMESIFHVVAR